MANDRFVIPKATDSVVIAFFSALAGEENFTSVGFRIFGSDSDIDLGSTEIQILRDENSYMIRSAHATKGQLSIHFDRNNDNQRFSAPDTISIHNNNAVPASYVLALHQRVSRVLLAPTEVRTKAADFEEAVESHLHMAARLEQVLEKIGERFAEERLKIQTEQDAFIRAKQDEFSRREAELLASIRSKEDALTAREKELDDRTNMHARRGIREDIKRRLQSYAAEFSLTGNTQKMRRPIHVTVLLSLATFLALIAYFSWQFGQQPANFVPLAKSALLTVAALGILAWYLRWLNRWFEQHADAELNLKQFELDVDRASWVVETAMEWRTSQHGSIPSYLLESISRNLFARRERERDDEMHPADYLASAIFGKASHAKISIGGNELELDRRGIKALEKDK